MGFFSRKFKKGKQLEAELLAPQQVVCAGCNRVFVDLGTTCDGCITGAGRAEKVEEERLVAQEKRAIEACLMGKRSGARGVHFTP